MCVRAFGRTAALAGVAMLLVGCFDFEAPDLPEIGAPAVLEASIHVNDSARVHVTGFLAPALTIDGERRNVPNDTLRVYGVAVGPSEIRSSNARVYDSRFAIPGADPLARPITLIAPRVDNVITPPPVIRWRTVRPAQTDTLRINRGDDLVLRILRSAETSDPAPSAQQWTMDLVSLDGNFRLGAQGAPPDTIRIPSYWVPEAANGRVTAYLTVFLNGSYRPAPGDYVVVVTADQRVRWDIRVSPR